jgi:hypothetical protein
VDAVPDAVQEAVDADRVSAAWDQVWGLLTELLGRPSVQAGYVVSAAVLVLAALILARRARWGAGRSALAAAAGLTVALFPALTLARRGVDLRRSPTCNWAWALEPTNAEQVLNLVVLLPAGFFAAWALRRAWPVVVGALVLSFGAEAAQAALDIGACEAGDMARNAAGAFAGAVLGALLGRLLASRRGPAAQRTRGG